MDYIPSTFISKASRSVEHLQENNKRGKDKALLVYWARSYFIQIYKPYLVLAAQKESRMKNKK